MSNLVKVTPKNLYSNYSILTVSEIIQDKTPEQQTPPPTLPLATVPFKGSQRKMLRSSKR